MPERCKFSTAGPLLAALLAFTCPATAENRTTVTEAPGHGPAEGPAPRVPVRRLLSDPGALAKWLYARNPDMGAAKRRQLALAGSASLLCWISAISAARMIAYW